MDDEDVFEIAEFTHNNEVINAGTSISSGQPETSHWICPIDFDDGSGTSIDLGEETFSFVIDHNETPNNPTQRPL